MVRDKSLVTKRTAEAVAHCLAEYRIGKADEGNAREAHVSHEFHHDGQSLVVLRRLGGEDVWITRYDRVYRDVGDEWDPALGDLLAQRIENRFGPVCAAETDQCQQRRILESEAYVRHGTLSVAHVVQDLDLERPATDAALAVDALLLQPRHGSRCGGIARIVALVETCRHEHADAHRGAGRLRLLRDLSRGGFEPQYTPAQQREEERKRAGREAERPPTDGTFTPTPSYAHGSSPRPVPRPPPVSSAA